MPTLLRRGVGENVLAEALNLVGEIGQARQVPIATQPRCQGFRRGGRSTERFPGQLRRRTAARQSS